jgi:hypothetical protein
MENSTGGLALAQSGAAGPAKKAGQARAQRNKAGFLMPN